MSEKMAHHHLLNLLIYSCSLLLPRPDSKKIFLRSTTLHSVKVLLLVLSFFNYPIRVRKTSVVQIAAAILSVFCLYLYPVFLQLQIL